MCEEAATGNSVLSPGYNIYTDMNYVAWLEQFHPEYLPNLGMYVIKCMLAITFMIGFL